MSEQETTGDGDQPSVRIRGIYTTALTNRLHARFSVVQASSAIDDRFDADFHEAHADATISTGPDRQGVCITGERSTVTALADALRGVGLDTFTWEGLAEGTVYDGRVTDTLGGGAVVDLGDGGDGYLAFDAVDGYVETGDVVRVQVTESAAPWVSERPELTERIEVSNGLVRLVRGGSSGGGGIDLASVLPTDPREGWGVRWAPRADDAGLAALGSALDDVNARAAAVDDALAGREPDANVPGRLTDGLATRWVWFGRESRFALDADRRDVAATMPGHHRIKAGTNSASAAVDFVEAVCSPDGEEAFPFGVVSRQFGPREGDRVGLGHGKPDGRFIVLGRGEVTAVGSGGTVTVERQMSPGGTYDALGVERRAGDVAVTTLKEGRWWYPTVYRGADGTRRGTYVNVCTPVELFPSMARYVDLHVDVVKHADGAVERVDDDELDAAVADGQVSEPLAEKARAVASAIERALVD